MLSRQEENQFIDLAKRIYALQRDEHGSEGQLAYCRDPTTDMLVLIIPERGEEILDLLDTQWVDGWPTEEGRWVIEWVDGDQDYVDFRKTDYVKTKETPVRSYGPIK